MNNQARNLIPLSCFFIFLIVLFFLFEFLRFSDTLDTPYFSLDVTRTAIISQNQTVEVLITQTAAAREVGTFTPAPSS